jgi:hypothetical protein
MSARTNPFIILCITVGVLLLILRLEIDPNDHAFLQHAWSAFWAWLIPPVSKVFTGDFVVDTVRSAIVAVVILALGTAWREAPKSLDLLRAKRFWGNGISGNGIALCFGTLVDSRLHEPSPGNPLRFVKQFRDGRVIRISGPTDRIIGIGEVRAATYFINMLSKSRRSPVIIEDDQTAIKLLIRSIVGIGSGVSNEITEIIEHDSGNRFFTIESGDLFGIRCVNTDTILKFEPTFARRDHGVILKIANTRFPGQYLFACAGLGEWGTSGAAWYLATHWKELDSLGNEFGCVVEVEIGSDQSARIVYDSKIAQERVLAARQEEAMRSYRRRKNTNNALEE